MRKVGNNYQNLQGPVTIGSPTGGYESAGSINAVALFINGVAVVAGTGAGGVTSVAGTTNQVTASPTTGAVVVGLPANVVIPNAVSGVALTISSSTTQALQVGATLGTAPASLDAGQGIALNNASTAGGDQRLLTFGQIGANAYIRPILGGAGPASAGLQIATSAGGTTFGAAGNVIIAAPSSGQALTVNGVASSFSTVVTSPNTAGVSNGLKIQAGTNTSDNALLVQNAAAASMFTVNGNGNVVVLAPGSGITLNLAGASGGAVLSAAAHGVSPTGVAITGDAAQQLNAISIQQSGQSQWFLYAPASSSDLRLFTGSDRVVFTSTGNVTINAPSSGIGLAVAGASGGSTVVSATIGSSTATAFAAAGPAATQLTALSLTQTSQTAWLIYQPASSNDIRFFAGADRVIFAAAGNVTINAPTSGQTLTVNGIASSFALQVLAPNTAGVSDGLWVKAGTNASDTSLLVQNAGGSGLFSIFGDGGVTVGAPTGGDKGLGTINATGLFVNGVAVGAGATTLNAVALTTQSVTSSTTYVADTSLTLALTTGKYYQIYAQVPFKNASGVTGGGANFAFTYSGTGGILWGDDLSSSSAIGQPQVQGVSPTTFNSFQNIAPNAFDTGGNMWVFFGTMFAGSVGGNLLVNWAQNTSSATATIRQIGAIMTAIQLN